MISGKGIVLGIPWSDPAVAGPQKAPVSEQQTAWAPEKGGSLFLSESIKALLRTLAARDPYTGQHSSRVTEVAFLFGRYLGLPNDDLQILKNAVYLHDIGKIGISDAILLKPGPLTPEERCIINTHPLIGEKIVEPLGLRCREREIILLHHERWDGQGYPQGLSQEEIPFLCRLTALADVFDALTTDRPYRRRFSVEEALTEIEVQAGKQFDPTLSQKFKKFISSHKPLTSLPNHDMTGPFSP